MTCQPPSTNRFFPATGPNGERHLIIECAGSGINELEHDARYLLEATGQTLEDRGGGVYETTYPPRIRLWLAPQTDHGE